MRIGDVIGTCDWDINGKLHLVTCSECGAHLSGDEFACPRCGRLLTQRPYITYGKEDEPGVE